MAPSSAPPVVSVLTSLLVVLASAPVAPAQAADNTMIAGCVRSEYQRCVHMADPLLKDARYIFPDNMADIDFVCGTWSQFVTCVKRYIDRCFTESRRQEFNKAVENPVDSVYQMCTVPQYQNEYLQHATCIKSTLTEDSHCGRHYRHLVEQVSGEVERVSLCCSHHRFRECVLDQTARQCDGPRPGVPISGSASRFARQILDKALSFLRDQCNNFVPNSPECPGLGISGGDPYMSGRDPNSPDNNAVNPRPAPVPLSPWEPRPKPAAGSARRGKTPAPGDSSGAAASGGGQGAVGAGASSGREGASGESAATARGSEMGDGAVLVSRASPSAGTGSGTGSATGSTADKVQKQDWAAAHKQPAQQAQPAGAGGSPWLPGRVEAVPGRPTAAPGQGPGSGQQAGAAQEAGATLAAGRPSSYGRGMSWPTSTAMTPAARTPAPAPADWMPNSYRVTNSGISRVSTAAPGSDPWFPSTLAGSDSAVNSNAVDEPNQQGLNAAGSLPGAGPRAGPAILPTLLAAISALVLGRLGLGDT
ncbi:transcription initiation factor TFIID subunit 4-like isoform X1 [Frankliniella occidentalis]|uniref:Transcription initiation factor TFIID subunit 4-like isoform X1 n=1 Tax=Frankliniella occidentalis TaxID=133901 RepID=A0A9C6X2Q7_FRAOC|nr:transcription initiation factor TFIID subunit 4-like isoform X1 [Frankliniella occidentalis]